MMRKEYMFESTYVRNGERLTKTRGVWDRVVDREGTPEAYADGIERRMKETGIDATVRYVGEYVSLTREQYETKYGRRKF